MAAAAGWLLPPTPRRRPLPHPRALAPSPALSGARPGSPRVRTPGAWAPALSPLGTHPPLRNLPPWSRELRGRADDPRASHRGRVPLQERRRRSRRASLLAAFNCRPQQAGFGRGAGEGRCNESGYPYRVREGQARSTERPVKALKETQKCAQTRLSFCPLLLTSLLPLSPVAVAPLP